MPGESLIEIEVRTEVRTEARSNGIRTPTLNHSPGSDTPNKVNYPSYVDNAQFVFKHDRIDLQLRFSSDWERVEKSMCAPSSVCEIYFPSSLELQFDKELENRLSKDLRAWQFFDLFNPSLSQLGIHWSRFCSVQSHLSYDRRVLLHHHLTWIFLMDGVSEMLPLYNLHATAGKAYLDNLKSIMRDGPIEDMSQFKGSCPDELIQSALNAQRIFAEDLMPLKRKLLSSCHLQAYISTFDAYFDSQYEEGHKFCREQPSRDILKTRVHTIGAFIPFILYMTSAQAELYRIDDPYVLHMSLCITFFNDMIGLYKDLDSLKAQDDGSVYLNLVRIKTREQEISEEDAFQFFTQRINNFSRYFEFLMSSHQHELQDFYRSVLHYMFNMYDYHLVGAQGKVHCRYGWKQSHT